MHYLAIDLCRRATHLDRDELVSVGSEALMRAARAYDASRGIPFGGYARRRIIGAFSDYLRSRDLVSRRSRARIRAVSQASAALTRHLGRVPTLTEVAQEAGLGIAEVRSAVADADRSLVALDEAGAQHLPSSTPTPEDELLKLERTVMLRHAVAALPGRLRDVVEGIYYQGLSVGQVADELGVTHGAVSHARTEALELLRAGLQRHYSGDPDSNVIPITRAKASHSRHRTYEREFSRRVVGGLAA